MRNRNNPSNVRTVHRVNISERILIAFILFYAGIVYCLPVPFSDDIALLYPWWANRIGIGNIVLHELFFIGWCIFYGRRFLVKSFLNAGVPTRQAAFLLVILALWCGLISLTAPLPWLDIGRTLRLLVNVLLMLAVVRWTRQMDNFPMLILVLGILVGTIINLTISFRYPFFNYGVMRLSGQNTPGVTMGIAVHLSAWLFFRASDAKSQLFALFGSLVFIFGTAISFSRIGWFAAGSGIIAWSYVIFLTKRQNPFLLRRRKNLRLVLVPLLVVGLVSFFASPIGQNGLRWVYVLGQQKISQQGESNSIRWSYAIGTAEILGQYPLGVGYSGFYDAMTATRIYRSVNAAEEVSPYEANPHASFLWYATAGGIPGALLAFALFAVLLNSMRYGLACDSGRAGKILFVLLAPVYLVIGMTVPYLFNSIILIVPAAIAAGWGWSAREMRLRFYHSIN